MSLEIDNLRVNYGSTRALDGISIKLEPGEMFFLLGPSGCGKSTLLRSVAGFIESFEGDIRIGTQSLKGVPPHKRDFGMVFQNYALFPHLTVDGNVAFGLEARSVPAAETKTRVADALQMVGLAGYGSRRPGELSGGQQQRVALARALVIRPRVLLLDEPLSNLDAKLRWEMREEIRRIHRQTKITTLYVTHDQKEALSLADRMAILRAGRLEALGAPRELYRRPPNRFSADFLGDVNALNGKVASDGTSVSTALGQFSLPDNALPPSAQPGTEATVFCRPESVQLLKPDEQPAADYVLLNAPARIVSAAFLGENTLYELELPGEIKWRALRHEYAGWGLNEGISVKVAVAHNAWSAIRE
ncbi:MAG TPA: ABC transporter ATP-binding protein [Planctomycetota bacterium]|nr:ABC transporter ATP-binding protein [Planctomycetota bacterium]